jgi:hypothetical protein
MPTTPAKQRTADHSQQQNNHHNNHRTIKNHPAANPATRRPPGIEQHTYQNRTITTPNTTTQQLIISKI